VIYDNIVQWIFLCTKLHIGDFGQLYITRSLPDE